MVRPHGGGQDNPQHAIRAKAGPAIAQPGDEGRREGEVILEVGQHDEVVLGAVPLGEPHPPMVMTGLTRSVRPAESSPARRARPGPARQARPLTAAS